MRRFTVTIADDIAKVIQRLAAVHPEPVKSHAIDEPDSEVINRAISLGFVAVGKDPAGDSFARHLYLTPSGVRCVPSLSKTAVYGRHTAAPKEALQDAAEHSGIPLKRIDAGAIRSWLLEAGWDIARVGPPHPPTVDRRTIGPWVMHEGVVAPFWKHEDEPFDFNAPLGVDGWTIEFTGDTEDPAGSRHFEVDAPTLRALADLIDAIPAEEASCPE